MYNIHYTLKDGAIGYSKLVGMFYISQDELKILDEIPRPDSILMNAHEIAETFPEAKPDVKRLIKEQKQERKRLASSRWEIKKWIHSKISKQSNKEFVEMIILNLYVEMPIKEIENRIKILEKILFHMTPLKPNNTKQVFTREIERARQVPISTFIDFNKAGFAKCPFHNEKSPSMKFYEKDNRVHCFGCHSDSDVIDVVMKMYNLKFLDAVKFINKQ